MQRAATAALFRAAPRLQTLLVLHASLALPGPVAYRFTDLHTASAQLP